jgi:hypothetical protein
VTKQAGHRLKGEPRNRRRTASGSVSKYPFIQICPAVAIQHLVWFSIAVNPEF